MPTTTVHPLGDQAALVYFDSEEAALRCCSAARRLQVEWLVDIVQAYASVAFFFDLSQITFTEVSIYLEKFLQNAQHETETPAGRLHVIPCCYEMGLDLERVAHFTGLTTEKIIELHTAQEYTVYAIGFCPGFPYLGYLPKALSGVPRLESPRQRLEAGSVGLTGRQTGVYTLPRPGGWNIIGRTPMKLVDVESEYFPLRAGDRVRFERTGRF